VGFSQNERGEQRGSARGRQTERGLEEREREGEGERERESERERERERGREREMCNLLQSLLV
jgi:hypothetical protein